MEENKHCSECLTSHPKCRNSALPFLLGVVFALAFGWWVFPDLMFIEKQQPFLFTHQTHVETVGLSCDTCHTLTASGSFTFPDNEACIGCHDPEGSFQTADPTDLASQKTRDAEVTFLTEYAAKNKEVVWLAHQTQPDNVYFTHAAHFKRCFTCHTPETDKVTDIGTLDEPQKLCQQCHLSLAELDKNPPVKVNILTGYSRTTMKMWQCERCHAAPGHYYGDGKDTFTTSANNACYTCHK